MLFVYWNRMKWRDYRLKWQQWWRVMVLWRYSSTRLRSFWGNSMFITYWLYCMKGDTSGRYRGPMWIWNWRSERTWRKASRTLKCYHPVSDLHYAVDQWTSYFPLMQQQQLVLLLYIHFCLCISSFDSSPKAIFSFLGPWKCWITPRRCLSRSPEKWKN